jgi:hypothetical protein
MPSTSDERRLHRQVITLPIACAMPAEGHAGPRRGGGPLSPQRKDDEHDDHDNHDRSDADVHG